MRKSSGTLEIIWYDEKRKRMRSRKQRIATYSITEDEVKAAGSKNGKHGRSKRS
jgi:hypothetical protein